jgi:hypothetical protein
MARLEGVSYTFFYALERQSITLGGTLWQEWEDDLSGL